MNVIDRKTEKENKGEPSSTRPKLCLRCGAILPYGHYKSQYCSIECEFSLSISHESTLMTPAGIAGAFSHESTCVVMSCNPNVRKFEALLGEFGLSGFIDAERTIKAIRTIEKILFRLNSHRSSSVKIATALFLTHDVPLTYCADFSGTTSTSIRGFVNLIKKRAKIPRSRSKFRCPECGLSFTPSTIVQKQCNDCQDLIEEEKSDWSACVRCGKHFLSKSPNDTSCSECSMEIDIEEDNSPRKCVHCATVMLSYGKKFCNSRCRNAHRKVLSLRRNCIYCGKNFLTHHSKKKYCSESCSNAYQKTQRKKKDGLSKDRSLQRSCQVQKDPAITFRDNQIKEVPRPLKDAFRKRNLELTQVRKEQKKLYSLIQKKATGTKN